jgi:O-antigen/teichoic acid export membrane protein
MHAVAELPRSMMSGRRLAHNAVWSFVGMIAPLLVGLAVIPMLIDGMGKERFGLLAIIWMGVGYFSFFDMGLGRALTKLVAERIGGDRLEELRALIWTALSLIVTMGVVGGVVVSVGAESLIQQVLNVDPKYQYEAIVAFRILGIGLPVVVLTTSLIGLLEAHQRFAAITAVRIPLGVLTFVGPLITLQFSPSLIWVTTVLLLARVVAAVVYYLVASSMRTELKRPQWPDRAHIGPLFHFGGWLTITNIVGPLMVFSTGFSLGQSCL